MSNIYARICVKKLICVNFEMNIVITSTEPWRREGVLEKFPASVSFQSLALENIHRPGDWSISHISLKVSFAHYCIRTPGLYLLEHQLCAIRTPGLFLCASYTRTQNAFNFVSSFRLELTLVVVSYSIHYVMITKLIGPPLLLLDAFTASEKPLSCYKNMDCT